MESTNAEEDGGEEAPATKLTLGEESAILTTIREMMTEIKSDIANRLTDFQTSFQADIKKQLNKMRADIGKEIEEAVGKIALTNERLEEAEQRIGDMETWSAGAKDAVNSLLKTQQALQAKVTELE